jgi:hypothetical protein
MIKMYKKLPIPVLAVKYTGHNEDFIVEWSKTHSDSPVYTPIERDENGLAIKTLEGTMRPKIGDYVVQGPAGECWFVNGKIFEETYEEIIDP